MGKKRFVKETKKKETGEEKSAPLRRNGYNCNWEAYE